MHHWMCQQERNGAGVVRVVEDVVPAFLLDERLPQVMFWRNQ
jgi:hypothetical protein